ncbi:MAG: serine/threonine-protein kinase [Polyangiaceae bacterium]
MVTDSETGGSATERDMTGRVLSERYRIDALIAKGAMGAVYKGTHLKMRKSVAIKILHPETEDFPELVERFEREAVAGAHVSHPNVAAASDMGTFDQGSYFLVLEYVKGSTLRELIARDAPMGPSRVLRLSKQLASALAAIHARGIVHRDLKPRNVMVTDPPEEKVKLIDFGLARVELDSVSPVDDEVDPLKRSLSAAGVVFGTVGYMAPETALGMRAVNKRSDLYSLGVLMYEMLAKEHPFKAVDPKMLFAMHRSQKPPRIVESNPKTDVPQALEDLVMKLLAKEPSDRPESADAVVQALDEIGSTIQGRKTLVSLPAVPPPKRSLGPQIAVGIVTAIVTAGILYFVTESRKPAPAPSASVVESAPPPPPSATEVPVVALAASAIGAKTPEDARLATRLRDELAAHVEKRNLGEASATLKTLGDLAPLALHDGGIRASALKLGTLIGDKPGSDGDKVFYTLAVGFGPDGLDLLYELRNAGGPSAPRAAALIEANFPRASPELRIALELERAACNLKQLLFDRAGKEGDARTLALLDPIRTPNCEMKPGVCCFQKEPKLELAIDAIKARLEKR